MSDFSNDSIDFDTKDDFIEDINEEIDYYALLNVPKDASIDEIKKAYKQRCLIFHPDRQVNDEDKKDASNLFILLRQAHDTLIDPSLRSVYDTVGLKGLKIDGWQLMERSTNQENIRKEYEFLKKLRENEIMLQRIHPTSSFIFKINASGLFFENPTDRYGLQLIGMSLLQGVNSALTLKDRIGLFGRVRANFHRGTGEGSLTTNWRRSLSASLHIDNSLSVSQDNLAISMKISKSIGEKILIMVEPTLNYNHLLEQFNPSIMLLYTMHLRPNWQGTIALNLNYETSTLTTSLVKIELNQTKYLINLILSPINSHVKVLHNKRFTENDSRIESSCILGVMGLSPSIQIERRLSRYSKISAGLSFSYPSCLLQAKFRLKTSLNNYEFHLVLCDNQEEIARSSIFGLFLPLIVTYAFKIIFQKPINKFMQLFYDTSEDEQVNEIHKEESQRLIHLMRSSAEKICRKEEVKHGLIILEGLYGQKSDESSELYLIAGNNVIDVTIPLQTLVNDSQLRIYSSKEQLPGFYDPCPTKEKMLKIVYKFRDQLHSVTVSNDQPINIPLRAHLVQV